jgi:hypothetical protein
MEDSLLRWKITGHYRYLGPQNFTLRRPVVHLRPFREPSSSFPLKACKPLPDLSYYGSRLTVAGCNSHTVATKSLPRL